MKKVNKRVGEIIFKRNFYEEEIKHFNHSANKQKRLVIKINNEKEQNKINNKTESSQFILFQQNAQEMSYQFKLKAIFILLL